MIPKIIHYCWLSGEPFSPLIEKCIHSWEEKLPDYEIKCWDMNNFDIHSVKFVEEACSLKKWAFAADYIRLYALYTEGGIYLDSDVLVKKTFNDFLSYDFFTSIEYNNGFQILESYKLIDKNGFLLDSSTTHIPGLCIQAAILGGIKGHPYLKDCMDFYKQKHFILSDSNLYNKIIAPDILARIAVKYGFRYKDEEQILSNNMILFPSKIFAGTPNLEVNETVAIHCCTSSWRDYSYKQKMIRFLKKIFK